VPFLSQKILIFPRIGFGGFVHSTGVVTSAHANILENIEGKQARSVPRRWLSSRLCWKFLAEIRDIVPVAFNIGVFEGGMTSSRAGAAPTVEAGQRVVIIDDPVLNCPFDEPSKHFRFTEDGITNVVVVIRRTSSYFIPVTRVRNRSRDQLAMDTEWTADRLQENEFINRVRAKVGVWRASGYTPSPITNTTRQLLEYWRRSDRERRLFFCQIEALETAIYLS
jgi:hypothetical protein